MKKIEDTETGIFHYINKASVDLFAYFDNLLSEKQFNINSYEWILLSHIINVPGKSQKWYGENLLKDKVFVMRLIDNLEKKKFLERKPDISDRRKNLIYITKKGDKLIKKSLPLIREEYNSLFSEIEKEHINITISVLESLIKKIAAKA
jgi:DNA-binding MarR family transcriptional regulator